ncbi:DnaJ domain protein [Choristoneura occidentalis alphabaculovirus]|nr:DnaJ domain protein [Choristoneura occidentalis alphabaculovirus]
MLTRNLKRRAEPEIEVGNRVKQNRCSLQNNDFLGLCSLQEIDYYCALKLNFEQGQEAVQNDADFALLVARQTNVVVKQVRKYSKLTDVHHNNKVHNVLILLQHARTVLMDKNKKRRYDSIIFHKNAKVLKICDTLMNQLNKINADLLTALTIFKNSMALFDISNVITRTLSEALENWLAAQPVVMERPSSTNRVLITWIPHLGEKTFDKQQKKDLILNNFLIYGEIKNVYVCDIDENKNTAIVEYKTQEAQGQAIEQSRSRDVRFTVTEYMLTKFYNSSLRAELLKDMDNLNKRLSDTQQQLMQLKSRYAT